MASSRRLSYYSLLLLLFFLPGQAGAQIFQLPCDLDPSGPGCPPVVLVPGLLASFNLQITLNDRVAGGSWGFIPSARSVYRGLIERFEQNGFVEGENLFIAHYDWRNSVEHNYTSYLIPTINDALAASGASQVHLVGHSMGGLVARGYAQSVFNEARQDVAKLITLGTPHRGAADAYVAREGGEFPASWSAGTKSYVSLVEFVLQKKRDFNGDPPETYRAFFPSLRDLLPIDPFVTRGGLAVDPSALTEPNDYLPFLEAQQGALTDRGIELTAIAGSNLTTLATIPVGEVGDRTAQDDALARWRDGSPNPDPPVPASTAGDSTVLLTSALFGSSTQTLAGSAHDKLPEDAQEEVIQAILGSGPVTPAGTHLAHELPSSALNVVILSPVDPTLEGPNGEVLSGNSNTFTDAELILDEEDPNGPKLLGINNPPEGEYTLTLDGQEAGDYDVIAVFADDQTVAEDDETGTTSLNDQDTYTFFVGQEELELELQLTDPAELLRQIIARAHEERASGLLRGYERANLTRPAKKALRRLNRYEYHLGRGRVRQAEAKLRSFHRQLDDLERDLLRKLGRREETSDFVNEIQGLVDTVRLHAPVLEGSEPR